MPATYTLIASNTLSSAAASVTFSAIPGTYTDLVLRYSARDTAAVTANDIQIRFNGDTATNYSYTALMGNGSAASSYRASNATYGADYTVGDSATADTFSSNEIYIPSYGVSQNKPFSVIGMAERNATAATMIAQAELWRNTAAITSIEIRIMGGATNLKAGSSFFLYGIKNS